jgi:hypothetical protein
MFREAADLGPSEDANCHLLTAFIRFQVSPRKLAQTWGLSENEQKAIEKQLKRLLDPSSRKTALPIWPRLWRKPLESIKACPASRDGRGKGDKHNFFVSYTHR